MRIQHNISALNSYRQLGGNNNMLSKNLEKLSSGYRINRAGDDAAGLAISEKMRSQIKGLETAQKNANDGISLVQTAEGALTEVHSMLNRMTELATQSANGTYDNSVDRANLQKEVSALLSEIDRISESTNFNGINLLDGSLNGEQTPEVTFEGAATNTLTESVGSGTEFKAAVAAGTKGDIKSYTVEYKDEGGNKQELTVQYTSAGNAGDDLDALVEALGKDGKLASMFDIENDGTNLLLTTKKHGPDAADGMPVVSKMGFAGNTNGPTITDGKYDGVEVTNALANGDRLTVDGKTYTLLTGAEATDAEAGIFKTEGDLIKQLQADGYKVVSKSNHETDVTTLAGATIAKDIGANNGLTLQIGDTADDFNQLNLEIADMSSGALGISNINIGTQGGAEKAVDLIKEAINKVSSTRGDLGAAQNRLEHTINNLGVTAENLTSAESRIRDTDMASEMMQYTKNNILIQASQAMLAQANQVPQGVLQLLQ